MLIYTSKKRSATLAVAIAAVSASAVVQADRYKGIEEMVVSVQKIEESLQDVPIAVTAFDANAIEKRGIVEVKDIGKAVPSLQVPSFPTSNDNLGFFIRGVGNADSNILTRDNSVGVYIDGVYLGRTSGMLADLVDLERIEVLRGPQGTLYGRNTTAGAVNLVSSKPTGELGLKQELSIGNFAYRKSRTTINLPSLGGIDTKVSYVRSDRDGWVQNGEPGGAVSGVAPFEDFNQNDQEGVRFLASFDESDNFSIDYSFDYSDIDSTHAFFQSLFGTADRLENSQTFYGLPLSDTVTQGHSLIATVALTDTMTFKSITGYREIDSDQFADFSAAFGPFATRIAIEDEQLTQEFQLLGTGDTISYVAGAYYLDEDGSYEENQVGGGFDLGTFLVDSEVESYAVYGQVTASVTDALDITLGARYSEDDRPSTRTVLDEGDIIGNFTAGAVPTKVDNFDYSFAANLALSESVSTYLRYATGFRSGGSSPRAVNFNIGYEEETVETVEIGLKSQLFENRIRVNAAVFLSEYDDYILDFVTVGAPGRVTGLNAGEGEVSGFESEILFAPTSSFQFGLNYTYLDAEIDNINQPDPSLGFGTVTDVKFLWAPRHAVGANVDLVLARTETGVLSTHLDYSWQDDSFASTGGTNALTEQFGQLDWQLRLDEVDLGEATAGFALWIKNVGDNDDPNYNLSNAGISFQEPRRYGVDMKFDF